MEDVRIRCRPALEEKQDLIIVVVAGIGSSARQAEHGPSDTQEQNRQTQKTKGTAGAHDFPPVAVRDPYLLYFTLSLYPIRLQSRRME